MRIQRCFNWIPRFKDNVELFERTLPGLWQKKVENKKLNGAPDGEDDVRMPTNTSQ